MVENVATHTKTNYSGHETAMKKKCMNFSDKGNEYSPKFNPFRSIIHVCSRYFLCLHFQIL